MASQLHGQSRRQETLEGEKDQRGLGKQFVNGLHEAIATPRQKPGVATHICNLSAGEVETGGTLGRTGQPL